LVKLRMTLDRRPDDVLHWRHLKTHSARLYAAQQSRTSRMAAPDEYRRMQGSHRTSTGSH
jgi:hypothetical protein